MFETHYETLQVAKDATQKEIKKSFRELSKKYHPDISKEENASEVFNAVKEAYNVIGRAESREAYDKELEKGEGVSRYDFESIFQRVTKKEHAVDQILLRVPVSPLSLVRGEEITIKYRKKEETCACKEVMCKACSGRGTIRVERRTVIGRFNVAERCEECSGRGRITDHKKGCDGTGEETVQQFQFDCTDKTYGKTYETSIGSIRVTLIEKKDEHWKVRGENLERYYKLSVPDLLSPDGVEIEWPNGDVNRVVVPHIGATLSFTGESFGEEGEKGTVSVTFIPDDAKLTTEQRQKIITFWREEIENNKSTD